MLLSWADAGVWMMRFRCEVVLLGSSSALVVTSTAFHLDCLIYD